VPGLEAVLDDPDVQRFTRVPVPAPPGFAEAWVERYEQGRRDGSRDAVAVVDDAGAFLGAAFAVDVDREGRTVELGYLVAPAARGRGVAAEALRLLTDWAFAELDVLRIELRISPGNEPSRRVAARCGYVREGLLRSMPFKQGLREDVEIWSRLPSD